ncbi:MAG: hypothetical protein G3I10_05395 [Ferrovum sp.]|nr:hypothetical protein [Ferrovum sp.]
MERMTEHAQRRKQQRGISNLQVDLIRYFGDDCYQQGGCTLSFITERRISELRQALERISKVAMVKGPAEEVITVMHLSRRIGRTQYVA